MAASRSSWPVSGCWSWRCCARFCTRSAPVGPTSSGCAPGSGRLRGGLPSSPSIGGLLVVAAPVAELLGWEPFEDLDRPAVRVAGAVIVAAFAAQGAMGDSWRADVDPDVRTELVTSGPFRVVRNPIFTETGATLIGFALLTPHPLAPFMLAMSLGAITIQVRLVEEPYLHRIHGAAWEAYAARTGRFVPWLGRLRPG